MLSLHLTLKAEGLTFLPPYIPLCDRLCKSRGLDCDNLIPCENANTQKQSFLYGTPHRSDTIIESKKLAGSYCRPQMS